MKVREAGEITVKGTSDDLWVQNFTFDTEPGEVFANEQEARRAAASASLDWLEEFIARQREELKANAQIEGESLIWLGGRSGEELMKSILQFPTMLRKMWSGGEVQDWLDANQELKNLVTQRDEGLAREKLAAERIQFYAEGLAAGLEKIKTIELCLAEAEKLLRKVDMRPTSNTAKVPDGWWNQRAELLLSLPRPSIFTEEKKNQ